uniref:Rrf2 family transcriptional regulator n=1 Tax=Acidicaldus sp. TaxID=1872105 RepID=A0A8J4HCJ6_9PROT
MRLTIYTDYTLRTLMLLALCPERLVTVAEIAETYDISESHITKVVHQLSLSGDVQTIRGRSGGMRLAKPPEAINLGAVVRRTESDFAIAACFENPDACPLHSTCVLEKALAAAVVAFLAVLDHYSIADLIAPRLKLQRALGLSPPPRKPKNALRERV